VSARKLRRDRARRAEKAARAAARAAGCTCRPDVERWHHAGRVDSITLAHDAHCALLRAYEGPSPADRTQLVVLPESS
jgi:hypothetical protein